MVVNEREGSKRIEKGKKVQEGEGKGRERLSFSAVRCAAFARSQALGRSNRT
jgi:hypothetical protein